MTNEEIDKLRRMFEHLDKNGDGKLSKEEIIAGCKVFSEDGDFDIQSIMERCDADGDGFLEYTEFLTATINWKNALSNDRLVAAFKLYDKDGSGKISLKELIDTLGNSGLDEKLFSEMISIADKNNDGEIDFEEFKELMKIKPSESNRI